MSEESPEFSILHPGDEISRFGNCLLIKCQNEDNAIVMLEIFRDIANGKRVIIGPPETQGNA